MTFNRQVDIIEAILLRVDPAGEEFDIIIEQNCIHTFIKPIRKYIPVGMLITTRNHTTQSIIVPKDIELDIIAWIIPGSKDLLVNAISTEFYDESKKKPYIYQYKNDCSNIRKF